MEKSNKNKKNKGITLIRKSNDLIEARYKFDVWETRFFLSVLAQIRREDNDFSVYRVWYKDIVKMFNLKTHQSYDMLREGAKKLMNKSFYVRYEDKGKPREMQYHILRKIDYSTQGKEGRSENQEYIDLTIEQEMKPFLLQLQKSFTTYDLRNVTKLGTYAIRIYELLKQYEVIGNRTFEYEEMKRMFELEKEYPRFPNFYQKVIQPAVREINRYTDLNIREVEKLKEGRKVTAVCFYFHKKNEEELNTARSEETKIKQPTLFDAQVQAIELPPQYDDSERVTILHISESMSTEKDRLFSLFYPKVVESLGVTPFVFADLIKTYNEEQINQAIRITNRAKMDGQIKSNPSGFFVQALKNGYTDQKEELTKKKKKEEIQQLTVKLQELEDDKHFAERQRIKELVHKNPQLTEAAIDYLQEDKKAKSLIIGLEAFYERPLGLEDYRQNKELRELVMDAIIHLEKEAFDDIRLMYDATIEGLKQKIA